MAHSEEFQRRIDDHLEDGWEVEERSSGRAVLTKPYFGDVAIHVLLFVFTAGIGNLIYGWLCYRNHPKRTVLTAEGTELDPALEALEVDRELEAIKAGVDVGEPARSLEEIRLAYARGDIDDAEFERLLGELTGHEPTAETAARAGERVRERERERG